MPISAIGTIGHVDPALPKTSPTGGADSVSFADSLSKVLENVQEKNQEANVAVAGMLKGTVDVHEAMLALHEAEESFEISTTVRTKVLQAYQEIMRMGM